MYRMPLVVALATAAGLGVALAQTGAPSSAPAGPRGATVPAGDREFAMKAAAAGLAEVTESNAVAEKTSNPDVKRIAQHLIEDHTKANNELIQIAQSLDLSLPKEPDTTDRRRIDRLSAAKGRDLDRDYLADQKTAHEEAIRLFTEESKNGKNEKLRSFASQTLPKLQEHYKMVTSVRVSAR